MSKGIATETIVKLLICLICLAILTFLIYKYVLNSGLDERTCAARMAAWCGQCQIAKFTGGSGMDSKLIECIDKNLLKVSRNPNDCGGSGGTGETDCKGFLPSTQS